MSSSKQDTMAMSSSEEFSSGSALCCNATYDSYFIQSNKSFWKWKEIDVVGEIWSKAHLLGIFGGGYVSQQIKEIRIMEVKDKKGIRLKDVIKILTQ